MINETTDVYAIMKKEFKETVEYFHLMDNKEIAAFLYYNAHNEQFIDTDQEYYHNVNFKNLDTGKISRMFTEGPIYFFPKGNDDFIRSGNQMKAFKITDNETKVIRVDDTGLYIEIYDLGTESIKTCYYDKHTLAALSEFGYAAGSIDYIEEKIADKGFKPDKIIHAFTDLDGKMFFSIEENNEVVISEDISLDGERTLYSLYYEKMKSMGLFLDDTQREGSSVTR